MIDTTGYNIRPLIAALIDAGFISPDREVERVLIDIEGDCSPSVYVQYTGDPDTLTEVLARIARAMPIVQTSTQAEHQHQPGELDALRYAVGRDKFPDKQAVQATKNADGTWDIGGHTYWPPNLPWPIPGEVTTVTCGRTTPDGACEPLSGAQLPPATHREDALTYAAAIERQRRMRPPSHTPIEQAFRAYAAALVDCQLADAEQPSNGVDPHPAVAPLLGEQPLPAEVPTDD